MASGSLKSSRTTSGWNRPIGFLQRGAVLGLVNLVIAALQNLRQQFADFRVIIHDQDICLHNLLLRFRTHARVKLLNNA